MDRIKRLSYEVLDVHKSKFGEDFADNKKVLDKISIIRSKCLKNEIAGYITKFIKKEIREEKVKQSQEAQQPETPKPEGLTEQPEPQKPEGLTEETEPQKPEGLTEQPETPKPEGLTEQPETPKPEGLTEETEPPKPEEASLNPNIVLLPDTNACKSYLDTKEKFYDKMATFFDSEPRFFIVENVMNEYKSVARKNDLEPVLSSKHKQCTDNVSDVESNQLTLTSEMQNMWVEKVEKMYKSINNDDGLAQQRRRWNMVKKGKDPEYPYSISISNDSDRRDIQILARAAFLADLAEKYKVVFFTFDSDFIAFPGYIRKELGVHILSAFWYFDHKREYDDPVDAIVNMSDPDLLEAYGVLDKHGKAKVPTNLRSQDVSVSKDDRADTSASQT